MDFSTFNFSSFNMWGGTKSPSASHELPPREKEIPVEAEVETKAELSSSEFVASSMDTIFGAPVRQYLDLSWAVGVSSVPEPTKDEFKPSLCQEVDDGINDDKTELRSNTYKVKVYSDDIPEVEEEGLEVEAQLPEVSRPSQNDIFNEEAADYLRKELALYLKKQKKKGKSKKSKKERRQDLKKHLKKSLKNYLNSRESKDSTEQKKLVEAVGKMISNTIDSAQKDNAVSEESPKEVKTKDLKRTINRTRDAAPIKSAEKKVSSKKMKTTELKAKLGLVGKSKKSQREAQCEREIEGTKPCDKKEGDYTTTKSNASNDQRSQAETSHGQVPAEKSTIEPADDKQIHKEPGCAPIGAEEDSVIEQPHNNHSPKERGDGEARPEYPQDEVYGTLGEDQSPKYEAKEQADDLNQNDSPKGVVQALSKPNNVSKMSVLDGLIKSEYSRLQELTSSLDEETKKREAERAERAAREREERDARAREAQERRAAERKALELEIQRQNRRQAKTKKEVKEKESQKRSDVCQSQGEKASEQQDQEEIKGVVGRDDSDERDGCNQRDPVDDVGLGNRSTCKMISKEQQNLQDEIAAEIAKLEALQDDFIRKVHLSKYEPTSILKSDIFERNILSRTLKSQKSIEEDSQLQAELSRLREAQSMLFAKGRELTHRDYD